MVSSLYVPSEIPILDADDEDESLLGQDYVRLDEVDKTEFWDLCRSLHPDLSSREYESMWEEAQQERMERRRKGEVH